MQKLPFHRVILPWVFAIAFIAIAPAVVFYTAGYRWNPKKGVIERNGTLIVDTRPDDARIYLNNELMEDRTPVTLQNVAPGTYEIRIELDGRHPWQKTLEMRPERVTFVNDVQLWLKAQPDLFVECEVENITASSNERFLAYLSHDEQDGVIISFLEIETLERASYPLGVQEMDRSFTIEWNENSTAAYIHRSDGNAWIAQRVPKGRVTELPEGTYHWNDGIIVGTADGELLRYDIRADIAERQTFGDQTVDVDAGYRIVRATGTDALYLRDALRPDRTYELPKGSWKFESEYDGILFLASDRELLGFDPDAKEPEVLTIPATGGVEDMRIDGERYLLSNHEGEIWLTSLEEKKSELILRKSERIREAHWFRRGTDIFFATDRQIVALNLDARDNRIETVLAQFDHVVDMTMADRILYISAKQDDRRGIFRLQVE